MRRDHTNHEVEVVEGRGPHAGEIRCRQCVIHIQWLTKKHYEILRQEAEKVAND